MKKVCLGDYVNIDSGYAFKSNLFNECEGLPIIRIRDVTSGCVSTYYSGEYDEKYLVKNGDLLISMDGSFVVRRWKSGTALLNQRVCRIRSKNTEVLLNNYIYHMLPRYLKYIEDRTSFVTVKHLSVKDINEIELHLPNIEVQEEITVALDKSQELMGKRKEQIGACDELIKSQFIEMFGDPISNHKGWKKDTIGSLTKSITAGWSANGEARKKEPNEKAVLKVSAVTQGYFKDDEYKVIDKKQEIKKYVFPQKGDLLFSRANTREMVGATCIIDKDYPDLLLPDKLWKVLFIEDTNVVYMKYIMTHPAIRAEFSAQSTGTSGSMYNVSMEKFKEIVIPIPPRELQNQFAQFVQQVDKLKFTMEESLREMEDNFNALMQRAFKGELF